MFARGTEVCLKFEGHEVIPTQSAPASAFEAHLLGASPSYERSASSLRPDSRGARAALPPPFPSRAVVESRRRCSLYGRRQLAARAPANPRFGSPPSQPDQVPFPDASSPEPASAMREAAPSVSRRDAPTGLPLKRSGIRPWPGVRPAFQVGRARRPYQSAETCDVLRETGRGAVSRRPPTRGF